MAKGIKLQYIVHYYDFVDCVYANILHFTSVVYGDIAQFLSLADGVTEQQNAAMMASGTRVVCIVLHLPFSLASALNLDHAGKKILWNGPQQQLP